MLRAGPGARHTRPRLDGRDIMRVRGWHSGGHRDRACSPSLQTSRCAPLSFFPGRGFGCEQAPGASWEGPEGLSSHLRLLLREP